MDLKNIFSKKISLAIIALLIGTLAVLYNLRGRNVIFPKKTTITIPDQNNDGLRIYDDTTRVDSIVAPERFPDKKLPL